MSSDRELEEYKLKEELQKCWTLLGRAIPIMHILNENEQAIEWLIDLKKYLERGADDTL